MIKIDCLLELKILKKVSKTNLSNGERKMKALSKLKSQSAILPIFTIVLVGSLTAYSFENLSLLKESEINETVETKKVEIFLTEPQKITRGEEVVIKAEVKAFSQVKNLKIF
ncbi:MAG: hypothetical protein QW412_02340, partial [Candidatus Aenigmatarchaeota archaeon]